MYDLKLYNDFIHGRDYKPMIKILTSKEISIAAFSSLLAVGETYHQGNKEATVVKLENKLREVYETVFIIFKLDKNSYDEMIIGSCCFSSRTKAEIFEAVSMLSGIAIFDS